MVIFLHREDTKLAVSSKRIDGKWSKKGTTTILWDMLRIKHHNMQVLREAKLHTYPIA